MMDPIEEKRWHPDDRRARWRVGWIVAAILAMAASLRGYQLGRLSFWYDEVVPMRLARAGSPAALIDLLFRIEATRAPLHPLLLEGWVGIFGVSEAAARALSVLCGVATVWLIFDIGRAAFDIPTGLWAAWLAALSPVLIIYSREAKMYAWLVLITCLCWRLLLSLRDSFTAPKAAAYSLALAALVYSQPLGLLMAAALVPAGLLGLRACFGSWRRWLVVHSVAAAVVAPWIVHYLDHPPEFLSGPLPFRFLLGTPIAFLGGNFAVLAALIGVIAWGIAHRGVDPAHQRESPDGGQGSRNGIDSRGLASIFLLLWLIVPPLALYVYSRLFHPIFGPPRYTIYSAPAFLILVGLGLSRSAAVVRYPLAIGLTLLAAWGLGPKVYDPELKADWRGFASDLAARSSGPTLVIVATPGPGVNVEVETARYYLPAGCEAIGLEEATEDRLASAGAEAIYLAVGLRHGIPVIPPPERIGAYRFRPDRDYPGLMTLRAEHGPPGGGLGFRGGGRSSGGGGSGGRGGGNGLEDG
jgi:mannosyltransferase